MTRSNFWLADYYRRLGSDPQDDLALSSSDRRLLPTRQFIKCMYTNEIPCEERGVQILTQQVRVGILVMDLGCYSGPRHFFLFLCLHWRIRIGRTAGSKSFRRNQSVFSFNHLPNPATVRICDFRRYGISRIRLLLRVPLADNFLFARHSGTIPRGAADQVRSG